MQGLKIAIKEWNKQNQLKILLDMYGIIFFSHDFFFVKNQHIISELETSIFSVSKIETGSVLEWVVLRTMLCDLGVTL